MSKPPRAARRAAARAADKLASARRRLAALEPGGTPERPLDVISASVVEPHAASLECLACGRAPTRVEDHSVRFDGGSEATWRVRVVSVKCPSCGAERELFFRVGTTLPS